MSRYIDADKLKQEFYTSGVIHTYGTQIISMVDNRPTADVRENVRGEWVKVDEQPYFRKHFHKVCCSVCRKQGYDYWNFCPNCGADMRGEA